MINRVLIRIRVVQIIFAYVQGGTIDLKKAENELLFSLQKSYDLYHYLLSLLIELTSTYEHIVQTRKSKLLPSKEDINPNVKLLENKFIKGLIVNKDLQTYLNDRPFDWSEHESFLRNILDIILKSDIYQEYTENIESSFDADRDFWRKVFKQIICSSEALDSLLEDESLYWNDDIEIVESFVLKTIKKFEESNCEEQKLLPMFKDPTDKEFAVKLLRETLFNLKDYKEIINKHSQNWDSERVALMDMVIMQIAVTELLEFSSIPVNVTLNEYIDIAKSYSTNKSASFINGILDSIVKELREVNRLIK